jgi:iron-sulfur cluster assembly accessory protein
MSDRVNVDGVDQTSGVTGKVRGFEVVVDRMSAPYLVGATIDFVDGLQQQGFTIDNPNAQGSCACGDSFH